MYFPEVYFAKVYFLKEYFPKLYFSKVYFPKVFLASQDALEVMRVTESLTEWSLALTLLMWPWLVMIPKEDFTDVILMTLVTLMKVILWSKLSSDGSYVVMEVI